MQPAPVGRADAIGPGDRAHERDRRKPDQRRGDDRPEVDIGRHGVDRDRVDGLVGHDEGGRLGRDQRGGERGQDQPQRSAPRSTSSAKMAPPSGTLQTAAMPAPAPIATIRRRCSSGKFCRLEEQIAEHGAGLLGAALAAKRGAHADDDDRERRAAERSQGRQAPGLKPDRLGGIPMPLPLVSRVMSHWPRPVTSPAPSSTAMWSRGLALRAASSSADGSATPGERLHGLEQPGESRRAKAGAHSRQRDGAPEADRAGVAEGRGNLPAGRGPNRFLTQARPGAGPSGGK